MFKYIRIITHQALTTLNSKNSTRLTLKCFLKQKTSIKLCPTLSKAQKYIKKVMKILVFNNYKLLNLRKLLYKLKLKLTLRKQQGKAQC